MYICTYVCIHIHLTVSNVLVAIYNSFFLFIIKAIKQIRDPKLMTENVGVNIVDTELKCAPRFIAVFNKNSVVKTTELDLFILVCTHNIFCEFCYTSTLLHTNNSKKH